MPKEAIGLISKLVLIFGLPSLVMNSFNTSSYALGITLAFCLSLFLTRVWYFSFSLKGFKLWGLLVLYSFISFIIIKNDSFNYYKYIASLINLSGLFFVSQTVIKDLLTYRDNRTWIFAAYMMMTFFVVNSLFPIFNVNLFNRSAPVGIFVEPSHFAINVAPFLLFFAILRLKYYLIFLLYFLLWGLFVENLTIMVVILLISLLSFKQRYFFFILICILSVITLFDMTYFMSRLDISTDSKNLSVLVFLNGWYKLHESLISTYGLGVGFQQLGYFPLVENSIISNALGSMNMSHLNKYDAGILAPKFISEFGYAGIMIVLFWLRYTVKIFAVIKKKIKLSHVFLASCAICLFLELFVRGIGYYSLALFFNIGFFFHLREGVERNVQL